MGEQKMTQKDQIKLLGAGFMIIRADYFRLQIKCKTFANADWKIAEKGFKTKLAMSNRMKELLQDLHTVED